MSDATSNGDVVNIVFTSLRNLELEPKPIPHGRIDELRGGLRCFDLKARETIDSAILISKIDYASYDMKASRALYRIDYAVRGSIKGVLPGRIITMTTLKLEGFLRKRLVDLRWEVAPDDRGAANVYHGLGAEGLPPSLGELWEGGPHQKLTEKLNEDAELMRKLRNLVMVGGGTPWTHSIISDRWGESIRICGSLWLKTRELPSIYITPIYLSIVDRIGRHLREVRRSFGGLTF